MISCERPANGNSFINKYICLDSEKSDIKNLTNGDRIYVIDKGITYIYDEENSSFVEYVSGHDSGGDDGGSDSDDDDFTWVRDGNTHFWIKLDEDRLSPSLTLNANKAGDGNVVQWGDGTSDTVMGTGNKTVTHTYAKAGSYRIDIIFSFPSSDAANVTLTTIIGDEKYYNALIAAEINGKNVILPTAALQNRSNLKHLYLGDNVSWYSSNTLQFCYALRDIRLPSNATTLMSFSDLEQLRSLDIPSGVFGVGIYTRCMNLKKLTIPPNVTNVVANAFASCYGMREYHFQPTTPPNLTNVNAFYGIPSDCKIYVPYSPDHSILEAYKTATNWSTYADYIVEEAQE